MKAKYERVKGMTSIYRKLRKECRSFNVRRHLATLILAVAMMAPAGVYADWTGSIVPGSEKPAGQALQAGWADEDDNFTGETLQFQGHGVIQVIVYDAAGVPQEPSLVRGSAQLTVDTVGEVVKLEECDQAFLCDAIIINLTVLNEGEMVTVELKGAFQQTNEPNADSQRGTLTLKVTVPAAP